MHFVSELDFYGCDPQSLLKSPEEVQKRLDAILAAKISMLEEILAHPYSPHYLHCSRNFIDYATPIEKAISIIRQFPNAPRNLKTRINE